MKKFLFDLNDFDEDALAKKREEEEALLNPTFSTEELEAARAEGYQKGRVDGIDEERQNITQRIEDNMQFIKKDLEQLLSDEAQRRLRFIDDTVAVCLDALTKTLPELHAENHLGQIKTFLSDYIEKNLKASGLQIFTHPDLKAELQGWISQKFEQNTTNITESLTVSGDASLPIGHCRIEWLHGGCVWEPLQLHEQILTALRSNLPDDYEAETPSPLDEEQENKHNETSANNDDANKGQEDNDT